jgi:hypothetical protein
MMSIAIHLGLILLFYILISHEKNYSFLPHSISLLQIKVLENSSFTTTSKGNVIKRESIDPTPVTPKTPVDTFYIPVSQLDSKPIILKDIDPNLLANFLGVQPQSLNLILLINEYGDVDRVLFDSLSDTTNLPERLLDDLKQRFLEAQFLPGRLSNQPVPSQMRIRLRLE